ncbi:MAG: alpha/beta hydrolase [Anaerofustis sp.]
MVSAEKLRIDGIPAVLWGEKSDRLILAVHGSHSSKIDDCIWILAEEAIKCGYQVLSFDLPQHGERVYEAEPCMVQECVKELTDILNFARQRAEHISVFGCSMGAYFSLLAYGDEPLDRVLFLSPVTDMARIIHSIMDICGITEEEFELRRTIENPIETLYWDYYCFVKEHPIVSWNHPTYILRGETDTLCEREFVAAFAERFGCELTEQKGGEHWFHTPEELSFFREWLKERLC